MNRRLPPVKTWSVSTAGRQRQGDHGYGPRGRWERWARYGTIRLRITQITEGSYRVHALYEHDGTPVEQNLGLVVKERGLWRQRADPGGKRVREEAGDNPVSAAEHLARLSAPIPPDPPGPAEADG